MCVCVFWRSLCLKFLNWKTILRDFCVDWIIGWVVCWIAFISVFFTSRKTVLKSWLDNSSTSPQYLAICRASQVIFFKCNLDTSSIPGGSIEKAPASSIAPRHLVDRSSFCSWIWFFVTRYLRCRRPVPRHLPQQLSRYLLIPQLSSITEGSIYSSIAILLSFLRSVRDFSSPKHSPFHSKLVHQGFFKLFQVSFYWVSF